MATLFDAITAGIAEAGGTTTPPAEKPDDETTTDETEGTDASDGEAGDADGTTGDADAGDGEGGEAAPVLDADGKPVVAPESGKGAPAKKEGAKPADQAGADAAKLGPDGKPLPKLGPDGKPIPKDPVNDPLPPNLKEATRERMTALIGKVKEISTERDNFKGQYNEILGYINDTGATPAQYSEALSYLSMVNSGDPAQLEKALAVMQKEVSVLARVLGKPVAGVDMLQDHPDLLEQVKLGGISEPHAQELAGARERAKMQASLTTTQAAQARTVEQETAIKKQGITDLNALETTLKAADPNYASKRAILIEMLKPVFKQIDPRQWAATFQAAYTKLPAPQAAAATNGAGKPAPKGVPPNQPLRANNPAGGQQPAPKSLLESINSIDFSKI